MRVLSSALKHGIVEDEIRAALQVPMRRVRLGDGLILIIGADHAAQVLEIVVADMDTVDPRVIHAMPLRRKFHQDLE
ncbi:MAG: hypothetical protein Q7T71_12565 [Herbiconiux sp.]|nr:hypothetical protein [Herbiconiux sp.]